MFSNGKVYRCKLNISSGCCLLQSSDGSTIAPGRAHPGNVHSSRGQPGAHRRRPRRGRHCLRAQHVAGQPVVATSFLVRVQVVGENQQRRGGVAQPAQPPQPPRPARHLSVGATAAQRSRICQRAGFAGVRGQAASPSAQDVPYAAIQGRLSEYWAMYAAGDLTTSALLRKCSHVYGPVNQ